MMTTCSRADTLRTPMKRTPAVTYIWVRRKMRAEGRGPSTEYRRYVMDTISIADMDTVKYQDFGFDLMYQLQTI